MAKSFSSPHSSAQASPFFHGLLLRLLAVLEHADGRMPGGLKIETSVSVEIFRIQLDYISFFH
jgi:hypothetical protein